MKFSAIYPNFVAFHAISSGLFNRGLRIYASLANNIFMNYQGEYREKCVSLQHGGEKVAIYNQ